MVKMLVAMISLVFFCVSSASADRLRIVSSIAPVHAIVVAVAGDRAQADLLLQGSASPHYFSLKPSHARLLQEADLLCWLILSLSHFLKSLCVQYQIAPQLN